MEEFIGSVIGSMIGAVVGGYAAYGLGEAWDRVAAWCSIRREMRRRRERDNWMRG